MKIDVKKVVPIFFVISVLIILFAPYSGDSTLGNDGLRNFLRIIVYLFSFVNFILVLVSFLKNKTLNLSRILFIVSFAIYYILTIFHTYNNNIQIVGFLNLILCIGYGISDDEIKLNSYKLFRKIWIVISLISVVCYISYVLKLPIPYTEVIYYNFDASESYISYFLTFIYKAGSSLRLCGICNEPGGFGTITALLLCASKLNLKDKGNIIMLIAGICTFSLAFVLIILIYLVVKSFKNSKIRIALLVLLALYIFVLPNIHFKNSNINNLIGRLSIVYNGRLLTARSNSELDSLVVETFNKHPIFGFGKGYVRSFNFTGIGTYKSYLVDFGFGGCILFWGLLFLSVIIQKNKSLDLIAFIIVFFASIYQRTDVMNLPYILLLYGGVQYINYNDNKSTKQDEKENNEVIVAS